MEVEEWKRLRCPLCNASSRMLVQSWRGDFECLTCKGIFSVLPRRKRKSENILRKVLP